jgi:hypothetical protein
VKFVWKGIWGFLDEINEVKLRLFHSTKSKTELKPAKRPAGKLSQQTVVGIADGQTHRQQRLGTPCPLSLPKIFDKVIKSSCAGWTIEKKVLRLVCRIQNAGVVQ